MSRPSKRRVLLFVILTILYACVAAFAVMISAIRTCSMQPDVAANCDPTAIYAVIAGAALLYLCIAVWFFRAKLNGVD